MDWRHGGHQQMLEKIGAIDKLPPPDQLSLKSDAWLFGRDDVTAAVAYATTMRGPDHGVSAGIMPLERSRVLSWVENCLTPHFALDQPLHRVKAGGKPQRTLLDRMSVPKPKPAMTGAEIEALQGPALERNAEIDRENARTRRAHLANAVPDGHLTVFLLHQGEGNKMRNQLLDTIEELLDLPPRREGAATNWSWKQDDFTLTVHARPLGALGAPLGDGTRPKRGEGHDDAIATRRIQVATALNRMTDTAGDTPQLTIIELGGIKDFRARTTDPKFAIRLGCAAANTVSQFIRPDESTPAKTDKEAEHRAEAAWLDGFRQLGVRFIPQHRISTDIPEDLDQLAFWVVKRRSDDTTTHNLFIPIAVLIRPGQDHIMGKADGMTDWVPYPNLLKHLAGANFKTSPTTEDEQRTRLAAFIRSTLNPQFRNRQTLIVTQAHNIRYRFPSLQNTHLAPDQIQFGDVSPQRLSLLGKHLRLVRHGSAAPVGDT